MIVKKSEYKQEEIDLRGKYKPLMGEKTYGF
jgi:hypothetical protein